MKEYFNSQNGKPITGKQGIINHIRKKYNCDIELAYLTENNITEKPVCKCGNLAEFRNFFIGYDEECNTCRISKPNNMQMGAKSGIPIYRRFDIKEFFDFYYKNIDLYPAFIHGVWTTGVIEPYTQKNTKSYTIYGYLGKVFGPEHFPKIAITCLECKRVSRISFFTKEFTCRSKICTATRLNVDAKKLREQKRQEKYESRNKDFDYQCKITGKIFNLENSNTKFVEHLDKLKISSEEYIRIYEPEKLRYCMFCTGFITFECNSPIDPYKHLNRRFCCTDHYQEYKRLHPGEIQSLPTTESKLKQSTIMKQKIEDGTFTPKNNKWTNWIKYPSLENNQYRSRWEIVWHLADPDLEYETIRVPYINEKGESHNYIVDFFDREKGILYEIKPSSEVDITNNILKKQYAEKYCEQNGYSYKLITDFDILKAFDRIDEKLIMEDLWGLKKQLQRQLEKFELSQLKQSVELM